MSHSASPPSPVFSRRPGITLKLFLVLLAVCAAMAVSMGVATRLSFQSGFLDYLGELEEERLTSLAAELADSYVENGNSWTFLSKSARDWRRTVGRFLRREPGPINIADDKAEMERVRRAWEADHLRSTLGLVAADKKTLVAGVNPGPGASWVPVNVNGTVTVGWLTRAPLTAITESIDLRFQEQQRKSILLISGVSLLLAAAVAVFTARTFLAPLRRLVGVTNQLTEGDLAARVPLDEGITAGDELHTLGEHLNLLARTLEQNESARRTFMAEISHDLRTPLAVLRGEVEAMEDGVRQVTPEALASLRTEVELLARLVDDIHTMALADLGTLAYRPQVMDAAACLRATLEVCKERITARFLALEVKLPGPEGTPLPVYADAGRLTQVFMNILENSLRYTDPGGVIQVGCRLEGESVHIDVLDSAPGVPEELLPHLFERFRTCDTARNRSTSGSGLGLAISRTLVEAQGGSIRALPSPLGGVWVRISLPLARQEA